MECESGMFRRGRTVRLLECWSAVAGISLLLVSMSIQADEPSAAKKQARERDAVVSRAEWGALPGRASGPGSVCSQRQGSLHHHSLHLLTGNASDD